MKEINQYVEQSIRTNPSHEQYRDALLRLSNYKMIDVLHALMGMTTEVGELMDAFKRYIFYGKEIDFVNLAEEAGDSMWYWALLTDVINTLAEISPDEVLQKNIDKLKTRYPEKFTEDNAINRDVVVERTVLEENKKSGFYYGEEK